MFERLITLYDTQRCAGSQGLWFWEALATALQQNDLSIATLDHVAPVLSSVFDRASQHVCGVAWLQKGKDMNWVSLWDPRAHRVHKDFKEGVGRAKLAAVMYVTTTFLNFTSGPVKSTGRWLSNLQGLDSFLSDRQARRTDPDPKGTKKKCLKAGVVNMLVRESPTLCCGRIRETG